MHPRAWTAPLLLVLGGYASGMPAATIGPVGDGFVLDGAVGEWTNRPPTLSLIPQGTGARPGTIWLAQAPQGLVIAGRTGGPPPVFAKNAEDMPNGDHVDLWIALAEQVTLPPIGAYSSMDGVTELRDLADCQADVACETWFADQDRRRRLLRRLFVRQWQLAPGAAVETYAKSAFEALDDEGRSTYRSLSPRGAPEVRFATRTHGGMGYDALMGSEDSRPSHKGYSFEALIPWEALPPTDRLSLDRLRVEVDVLSPGRKPKAGPLSTTSQTRQDGQLGAMNAVSLSPPRSWRLSPCGYPLEGRSFWDRAGSDRIEPQDMPQKLSAYFLPEAAHEIASSFVLDNDWVGRYWAPTGVSPLVVQSELFSHRLSPRLTICGPDLAVRHGDQVSFAEGLRIEPSPAAKKVPGGWLLVGASTGAFRDPEGQCGACEDKSLDLHFIPDSPGPPRSAFRTSGIQCDCCVGACIEDIRLSDDFKHIQVTGHAGDGAARETATFCFDTDKHLYLKCQPDTAQAAIAPAQDRPPADLESLVSVRAQVSEGLAMAGLAKVTVAEHHITLGRFPIDNAEAGLPAQDLLIGNYVSGIRVEDGAIHIAFGNRADKAIRDRLLSLRPAFPTAGPSGHISWWCGYAPAIERMSANGRNLTSIPALYLPVQCRGQELNADR